MTIAKQLFDLQEIDVEIDAHEAALKKGATQLGESPALVNGRAALATARERLDTLTREQRSIETDIADLDRKIGEHEGNLYSGRIHNPKELSSLQQEISSLKARRNQLEEKALAVMEQAETARGDASRASEEYGAIEAGWRAAQEALKKDLSERRTALTSLKSRRQSAASGVEPQSLALYEAVRKGKSSAVASVRQGVCSSCRISLPVSDLQRVRSGSLVQCSSCGRILYLP